MSNRRPDRQLPKSVRIHIRRRKAEIRRQAGDPAECRRQIAELCGRFRGSAAK
ncbi:MAG: hypothetical protein ABIJ46_03070 [bacterium]